MLDNDQLISLIRWSLEYLMPRAMILTGTIVFLVETIFQQKASYGRYNSTNSGMNASLAWFIQETPAFLVPLLFLLYGNYKYYDKSNNYFNLNVILLGFFMLHYFHRSFIYTLKITSKKKVGYMENFLAFGFCMGNGAQIAYNLLETSTNFSTILQWHFIVGTFLFFLGLYINIDSDNRLISLRKSKEKSNFSGYKIPTGGLFEYVSAANYFGECLEWFGFAIAAWSLSSFAFAYFTLSNIGPRAYHHHLFYKEQFGEKYPKNRKALIPFLI